MTVVDGCGTNGIVLHVDEVSESLRVVDGCGTDGRVVTDSKARDERCESGRL